MASFIGDYTCKADAKCRVVVPALFRRGMAVSGQSLFVLRKNIFEKCLDLYPLVEWEKMLADIKAKLNLFNARYVAFFREFCRGTQEVELDANGRILLPRRLLEEIGVDKDLVMAGQDDMIQIWSVDAYAGVVMAPEELGALAEEIFKE